MCGRGQRNILRYYAMATKKAAQKFPFWHFILLRTSAKFFHVQTFCNPCENRDQLPIVFDSVLF